MSYDCETIRDSVEPTSDDDCECSNGDDQDDVSLVTITQKCSPDLEYRDGLDKSKGCYDGTENMNENALMASRRVSFPKSDRELVTGYLEPANPWESVSVVKTVTELSALYKSSCEKHNTHPLQPVLEHLESLELAKAKRHPCLSLKDNMLSPESCEALEEILKRVQYQIIDLTACDLNDVAASALFDMIEYYEAANDLDISGNPRISSRGWQSCISMIRRSRALQTLTTRGIPLSEINAANLGKSLNQSCLHTIKLEHCGLTGRPLYSLCNALRKNTTLRELWLGYNDLSYLDAERIGGLLKTNAYLQFLDISNNSIKDVGVKHLVIALIEQSTNVLQPENLRDTTFSQGALSLYPASTYKNLIDFTESNVEDNTKTEIFECDRAEGTTNSVLNSTPGRSMLDTLLSMNSKNTEEIWNESNLMQSISNDNDNKNVYKNIDISANFEVDSHTEFDSGISLCDIVSSVDIVKSDSNPNLDITSDVTTENTDDICQKDNKLVDITEDLQLEYSANNNVVLNDNKVDSIEDDVFNNTDCKDFDENKNTQTENIVSPFSEPDPISESLSEATSNTGNENLSFETDSDSTTTKPVDCPSAIGGSATTIEIRARSLSSDSLNSDTSIDMSDSNLSVKINEKLTKNDTLGRQKPNIEPQENYKPPPRGLQAIILWNNNITRESGEYISDLLAITSSIELLNIGKNILSNDFVERIKDSLKQNTTLTNLGLQSAHLTCAGIKTLSNLLQFGGNCSLQRIDIRDNNIQVDGLLALAEALKSNKSVTRIDIDDVPKRAPVDGHESLFHYSRALHTIRTLCSKNATPPDVPTSNNIRKSNQFPSSRKISLTCQSIRSPYPEPTLRTDSVFDGKKKSGSRLRSPLPSPPTASPSSSPVPSPSRSRFQVFRVIENNTKPTETLNIPQQESPPKKMCISPGSRFRVTVIERPTIITSAADTQIKPDNVITSTEKSEIKSVSDAVEIKPQNNINTVINFPKETDKTSLFNTILNEANTDLDHSRFTDESFSSTSSIDSFDSSHESKFPNFCYHESKTTFNSSDSNDTIDSRSDNTTFYSQNIIPDVTAHYPVDASPVAQIIETLPKKESTPIEYKNTDESSRKTEPESRVRKVSWISSANYPNTVDKLLNLFQHPGNIFSRSTSPENEKKIENDIFSQSIVQVRKETPPSLFTWHKANQESKTIVAKRLTQSDSTASSSVQSSFFDAASKQIRGFADFGKQVFKQNVPFGDTINSSQQTDCPKGCDSIPTNIKLEIKENISPDHTLTANSVTTFHALNTFQTITQQQQATTEMACDTNLERLEKFDENTNSTIPEENEDSNVETGNSFDTTTSSNTIPESNVNVLLASGFSGES